MTMILAARVDLTNTILERGIFNLIDGQFNTRTQAATNGKPFMLPIERIGFTPFNSATQKRSGPVDDVQAAKVVETYTVTNKTVQELDDEKTAIADADIDRLGDKTIAAETWVRTEEIIDTINALLIELSATTPKITKLSADDFKTRLRLRHKALQT